MVRPGTGSLDGRSAADVVARANAAGAGPVVIDLSEVTSFDSDGIGAIAALTESSAGRVSIDGFAAATGRIVALGDGPSGLGDREAVRGIEATRIRQVTVLRPVEPGPLRDGSLERMVEEQPDDVATVVVDLGAVGDLDAGAVQGIAFASSGGRVREREVLVVNASEATLAALRGAGLSGQTWLAPPAERPPEG